MICKICLRKHNDLNIINLFSPQHICVSCYKKMDPVIRSFNIEKNIKCTYFYNYNAKIREMIYALKAKGDYEMSKYFLMHFINLINLKYRGFAVIFAPSWHEDDENRGFNHVQAIFEKLKLDKFHVLKKIEKVKQSERSKSERQDILKFLAINDIDFTNRKILLVDDVFTTGSTIKACIHLLKTKNPKKIEVLVISRKLM